MTEVKPVEEDVKLNPQEGDEVNDDVDKYFEDGEESNVLDEINKATNKKFTKEALVDYIKKVDVDYAKGNVKPAEVKQDKEELPQNLDERLLKAEEPLTKYVLEEMKAASKVTGKSLTELWADETGYFKNKAIAIESKLESKDRIARPSNTIDGKDADSEEKQMSKKFMKNFPSSIKTALKSQGVDAK